MRGVKPDPPPRPVSTRAVGLRGRWRERAITYTTRRNRLARAPDHSAGAGSGVVMGLREASQPWKRSK